MKRGQHSEKIRILQRLLILKGARLVVDGHFGFSTENAVRIFQKSQKIKVDGVVGAQTWESLVVPLRRGSRGSMVRTFQMLLNQNGYRVKQDGVFGAATEKAVRNYQKKQGEGMMIADGRASKWVWCWLLGGMNISD
ncbi:peptidoglycan-binding domain-containing protein [Abditibacterium utsteinense]|nr:peptidoglycan-binding protein [Abditibacterium utsteinense]